MAQALLAMVATCEGHLAAVRENGLSAVAPLVADYMPFKAAVDAHFTEEEQVCLPMMRASFSADDFKAVQAKMRLYADPAHLAWMLRIFPDDGARRDWLARVAGIPDADISGVMMPACKKYESVLAPMRALIDGAKEAPAA